jgi:hypothetical protein
MGGLTRAAGSFPPGRHPATHRRGWRSAVGCSPDDSDDGVELAAREALTRLDDLNTGAADAMNPRRTLAGRREWSTDPNAREPAALRRVAAQITAEAAELPDNTWLEIGRGRLRGRVPSYR